VAIRITDPDTNPDPYSDTGKTCLGGGTYYPSVLGVVCVFLVFYILQ